MQATEDTCKGGSRGKMEHTIQVLPGSFHEKRKRMNSDTKTLVAITALNKMFEGGHFSICTIDSVAQMLGVIPDREAYETLRPLHCVDWQKMPKALRDQVPGLVQQALLGDERFRFELAPRDQSRSLQVIDETPHTRRPLLKRVFG